MMLWQFASCVAGFNRIHSGQGDKPDPISDEVFEAEIRKHGYG